MASTAPDTHRFHLVTHPDGRQTVAVYSATEVSQIFSAEAIAFLMVGKFVVRDGKRHVDLVAFHNHHADSDPAPGLLDHIVPFFDALRERRRKAVA